MEFTEIKGSVFGYSKKDVCTYISHLNDIHSAEIQAKEDASAKAEEELKNNITGLTRDNEELSEKLSIVKAELEEMKAALQTLEAEKLRLSAEHEALLAETEDLRAKSEVISTAIINAEKCASTMINDANVRAQDMITAAEGKVDQQVKRLETAKKYITEVRANVEETLKNIDRELAGVVSDITVKTDDVNSYDDRKATVKEKFGMLEKSLFKRA